MKNKKTILIALGIILTISIISIIVYKKTKVVELKPNDKSIAVMVENDTLDGYHEWTSSSWPTTGYQLSKSTCKNGGSIKWNDISRTITMSASKSDSCTLYFNKIHDIFESCPGETNLVNCFEKLKEIPEETDYTADNGKLYIHTTDASAEDGGIRYAGSQPNNYICFGAGSEAYNNGETDICPLTNKYRIIGYYPFDNDNNQLTSSENADKWLIKIIKAEYPTENELGITKSTGEYSGNANTSKVETTKENTDMFSYYGKVWSGSSIFNAFNNTENGYLKFLYGNEEENQTKWEDMIETINWNVGGCDYSEFSLSSKKPKDMYDCEMTDSGGKTTGSGTHVTAKVGLMYFNDHNFAAEKTYWKYGVKISGSPYPFSGSWLYTGLYEGTISPNAYGGYAHYSINWIYSGDAAFWTHLPEGVRPVLYLNPNVQIIKDDTVDGRRIAPYKVSMS